MHLTLTAKRQATFPARVLDALGVGPGDRLELIESPDGYLLRPMKIDSSRLAPLRGLLKQGQGTFTIDTFREEKHDPALRD